MSPACDEREDELADITKEIHRDGVVRDLWSDLPVKYQTTLEALIEVAAIARYEELYPEGTPE